MIRMSGDGEERARQLMLNSSREHDTRDQNTKASAVSDGASEKRLSAADYLPADRTLDSLRAAAAKSILPRPR